MPSKYCSRCYPTTNPRIKNHSFSRARTALIVTPHIYNADADNSFQPRPTIWSCPCLMHRTHPSLQSVLRLRLNHTSFCCTHKSLYLSLLIKSIVEYHFLHQVFCSQCSLPCIFGKSHNHSCQSWRSHQSTYRLSTNCFLSMQAKTTKVPAIRHLQLHLLHSRPQQQHLPQPS